MALFTLIVLVVVTVLIGLGALVGLWQALRAAGLLPGPGTRVRSRRGLRS
ncbi:MAG: hypothetical protein KDB34_08015 [Propionibacteriaceae bacterium]|nr:hypothetical protein [Brooklawnia sp. SH051]MCB0884674.1 hypothetical protein [Propionibacteriaceae bacterium]MEA5120609.1 hypothetical protein [Propionibacterium sp.]NLI86376.1 hypothetical protein [Propionibacterium sp.]